MDSVSRLPSPAAVAERGEEETAGEVAGVLPTVLFCPEDLMILKMGASQWRRFGDLASCALRPNYDAALTEYNRILEQKSRILKDHFENPGILEILPEYNTRLCQVGALLILAGRGFTTVWERQQPVTTTSFPVERRILPSATKPSPRSLTPSPLSRN